MSDPTGKYTTRDLTLDDYAQAGVVKTMVGPHGLVFENAERTAYLVHVRRSRWHYAGWFLVLRTAPGFGPSEWNSAVPSKREGRKWAIDWVAFGIRPGEREDAPASEEADAPDES